MNIRKYQRARRELSSTAFNDANSQCPTLASSFENFLGDHEFLDTASQLSRTDVFTNVHLLNHTTTSMSSERCYFMLIRVAAKL